MSEYPKYMSEPTVTTYGDFDIAVRTSTHLAGFALNEVTASYEISQAGKQRWKHSVVGGHPSTEEAANNALSVAKQVIAESGEGPIDDNYRGLHMQSSRDKTGVNYGSYVIVHQPEGNHRRRTDSYAILCHRENGGPVTHHAEPATGAKFDTEGEACSAAIRRAREWIDANTSTSE